MRAFVLAALGMLAAAAFAQQPGCNMSDPFQPGCQQGTGLPTPPAAAGGGPVRGAVPGWHYPEGVAPLDEKKRRQCASRDPVTNRCQAWKMTPEEYDQAIQTGIDASNSMLGIQRDVYERLGAYPGPGGALPVPAAQNVPRDRCVAGYLMGLAAAGRAATRADDLAAVRACAGAK